MRRLLKILIALLTLTSCGQNRAGKDSNLENTTVKQKEKIFELYDSLETKFNSLPTNFDTLYFSAKELNKQADNYKNQNELRLAEIYKKCAETYRIQESENCNTNKSQLLCNKDSLLIIKCYKNAIRIYIANADTTNGEFTDALFQLADVYEQLEKPELALPLRTKYLNTIIIKEGLNSEMTGDAYMFIGGTYEILRDYKTANYYYSKELENRQQTKHRNIEDIKKRILNFQRDHKLK